VPVAAQRARGNGISGPGRRLGWGLNPLNRSRWWLEAVGICQQQPPGPAPAAAPHLQSRCGLPPAVSASRAAAAPPPAGPASRAAPTMAHGWQLLQQVLLPLQLLALRQALALPLAMLLLLLLLCCCCCSLLLLLLPAAGHRRLVGERRRQDLPASVRVVCNLGEGDADPRGPAKSHRHRLFTATPFSRSQPPPAAFPAHSRWHSFPERPTAAARNPPPPLPRRTAGSARRRRRQA
jgi:hypothetical protein